MKDRKWYQYLLFLFAALVLWKFVDNYELVKLTVSSFLSLLSPFFIAFGIAYLLKALVDYFEGQFRMNRIISITAVYLLFFSFIGLIFTFITPIIIDNIGNLISNFPKYISDTNDWITKYIVNNELFEKYGVTSYVNTYANDLFMKIGEFTNLFLNKLADWLISLTSTAFNILIGIIISIYMLKDKEAFGIGAKKMVKALLTERYAKSILQFFSNLDEVFSKFLVGKLLDSLIIGILCFIGLLLLNVPYALLISLIVGITNMIPYFGPFIGMVPAVIITLFNDPIQALWVAIFIFGLQQFDGYYLGPKILGDKVGLSPVWIILAIIIGGGTMGVIGMFIAVPIVAVIKTTVEDLVEARLSK
ncbi:AI-2E family transporter [Cytobacillus sp. Hm23]